MFHKGLSLKRSIGIKYGTMPGLGDSDQGARKRKYSQDGDSITIPSRKYIANDFTLIALLEQQITESRKYYNGIPTLLGFARRHEKTLGKHHSAALALCRIFCRLMATGSMTRVKPTIEENKIVVRWLRERYQDYQNILLDILATNNYRRQSSALTLLMQLVKEEIIHLDTKEASGWENGLFKVVVEQIVFNDSCDHLRTDFVRMFAGVYDDIRIYTYKVLSWVRKCPSTFV